MLKPYLQHQLQAPHNNKTAKINKAQVNSAYVNSAKAHPKTSTMSNNQLGFTLIELMISITLGLLITAAAIQVFLVSSRTAVIQQSGSQIIDANIFGLQNIEKRLRLANLGMAEALNVDGLGSGIIVSSDNLAGVRRFVGSTASDSDPEIDITFLTRGSGDTAGSATDNQWTGISNTTNVSDQLTVQYRAPQDMTDCEGKKALGPREVTLGKDDNAYQDWIDGQVVIERYFLRMTDDQGLVLACNSGRYITEEGISLDQGQVNLPSTSISKFDSYTTNRIQGLDDGGIIIIPNVDDFQVLLGVMTTDGIRYVTSRDYINPDIKVGDTTVPIGNMPIVAIKVGIITRGNVSLPVNEEGKTTFKLLGDTVTLKDTVDKDLIRKSYESNIMLRNARQI